MDQGFTKSYAPLWVVGLFTVFTFAGCAHKGVVPGIKTHDYLRSGSGLMTELEYSAVANTEYDGIFRVNTTSSTLSTKWDDGNYSNPISAIVSASISNDEILDTTYAIAGRTFKAITRRQRNQTPPTSDYFWEENPVFQTYKGGNTLALDVWETTTSMYYPKPFIMDRAPMEWNSQDEEYEEFIDRDHFTIYWNADPENTLGVLISIQSDENRSNQTRPMHRFIVPDNGQFTIQPSEITDLGRNERVTIWLERGNYQAVTLTNGRKFLFYGEQSLVPIETRLR